MAQPKSNPQQAHHAPQGASVSMDKIAAALQAAQQQLSQDHLQDPWAMLQAESESIKEAGEQGKGNTSQQKVEAVHQESSPEISAASAAKASFSQNKATEDAASDLASQALKDMGKEQKDTLSDADAAMAAAFGLDVQEDAATDAAATAGADSTATSSPEPTLSDADAAMAAAFGLEATEAEALDAADSADTSAAAAAADASDATSASDSATSTSSSAAGNKAGQVMSAEDRAMAEAFGMALDDVTPPEDGDLDAESGANSTLKTGVAAVSNADAAMAATLGVVSEGHISTEKDEPESESEKTFSMEHGLLSDDDAAMAAVFNISTSSKQNAALQDAGASLAAQMQQQNAKVRAVATPTMGADFEHAAEDMAMVSAHMQYIMDTKEDQLPSDIGEHDFDFNNEKNAALSSDKSANALPADDESDDFDVSFEDELLGKDSSALESIHKDKAELDAEKAKMALNADDLNAIAQYFEDVANAGHSESKLRPSRRLQLENGRALPYPFVGEYHYYFELPAPLEEDFLSEDDVGLSTSTGYSNSRSLSLHNTLSSMGALIRHFSNSSSYQLNHAQEWKLQLHLKDSTPITVEVVQVSATSAGTGAGAGLVLKTSQDLSAMGLDLSEGMLFCDEGKYDLMSHADKLSLLAQVVATDASEAEAHAGEGESGSESALSQNGSTPQRLLKQHCPELTSRLAAFVSQKRYDKNGLLNLAPNAELSAKDGSVESFVTGLRLEERSENSLDLSPDLSDEQKKAVTSALSYDLSYIITGAQNKDTTLVRELILALMGQRKSVLVIDRDPANLHAIFRDTEKSLQEQEKMAEAYGDPSSALNTSYQDTEDQTKTGVGINPDAVTVVEATAEAESAAEASTAASAAAAAANGSNSDDDELGLSSTERMAHMLQRWHEDYPLLRLSADFSSVPANASEETTPDSKSVRVSLEAHLQQRLQLLTQFGHEQQSAKEERLTKLERLLVHVQWLQESKLEELARNLKQLSQLKRQRAEHQNKLNHMQQAYEHQHDLLLKALTPQIVALRKDGTDTSAAAAGADSVPELTMAELMDFSYEEPVFKDVESDVQRLWQKIQDDQELYQDLKNEIKVREQIMRQVMYRQLPRQIPTKYHRDNTKLSEVRAEYQQLVQQKEQLSQEYKETTAEFNHLLLRLRFLKPQHQLHLKFEHLKNDNNQAVATLSEQINKLHEHNLQMFATEQDWCQRCGFTLKEHEFSPQAWKELTSDFLEVKHGISSTQFLMDNWRFVADGSLSHLLTATSTNPLSSSKDDALNEIQKAAALSRAAAGHADISQEREAEIAAPFEVNVSSISKQLSLEQEELSAIKDQLKITPEQVAVAKSALISQCPVVGAIPHEAITTLKHSFNTVIINNAQQLLPIDFWLLTTLARERLVIIGDVMQMGGYAQLCGNSLDIRKMLFPSIFTLTGIKELLYRHQLSYRTAAAANESAPSNHDGPALPAPAIDHSIAAAAAADVAAATDTSAASQIMALPANVTLVHNSELRPQELTVLLNLFYAPFMALYSYAEQQNSFLEEREEYYRQSKLSAQLQEHSVHLLDTAALYPWMHEMAPQDYNDFNLASLLRYDGFNVISAAYNVLLAFKLVSSLLICTQEEEDKAKEEEKERAEQAASNDDPAASGAESSNSSSASALDDDIEALLAANSPAATSASADAASSSSAVDDLDIDALLAANNPATAAAAADSSSSADSADADTSSAAFKPHLASWVLRDRVNSECAAEPRVIIVSIYPQQALFLQLMVKHLYQQLGFAHDLNLIAVSDGATLSNASAPAVILDLTIDAPYHNGLYFDAPHSDPGGNNLGAKREEFLQQHLCSAISAAQYDLFVVGDITRLLERSQHQNNALYQLLKTMMLKMQLPLYNAQSALQNLTDNIQIQQGLKRNDKELSFVPCDATPALRALNPDYEHEHNYSDRMHLLKRLVTMTTESDEESTEGALSTLDLLLRTVEMPELSQYMDLSMKQRMSVERINLLQQERAINIFGANEESCKDMLHDMQSAQRNVLIMSPLLDEVRYQSFKPLLSALMAAGRKVMVMTLPLDLYPESLASAGSRTISNLKEMMVRVVFAERCFYQGILVDDHILWLTTFTPLSLCTHHERAQEMMIRIAGSAALNCVQTLHLPLLVRNIQHLSSCPLCGSALVFNAQHAQLHCQRYPQCGFILTGKDELNSQGELLCPNCHSPLHLHIINRADGSRGFALRCSKCNPPEIYGLSTSHLLLPYIRKQIESTKGLTLEEVQSYVSGEEQLNKNREQRLINELENPAPSAS